MNKQHDVRSFFFIVNKDLLEEFSREFWEIVKIEHPSNTRAHFHVFISLFMI
jgi:hypothetical protein